MEIKIKGITKKYKNKIVLNGIDFSTNSGKCIGILGLNGSGKSTLLSILSGIKPCDSGSFFINDADVFAKKFNKKIIGYVPQGTPLLEELSAFDNLSLWYDSRELKNQLSDGFLSLLKINDFLDLKVAKMSGGMKKRLAIACAISNNPAILFLDEPMSALDLPCKQIICKYIKNFTENGGIVLLTSHDLMEIELCDECYILKNGKLELYQFDGNIDKLINSL